MSLIKPYRNGFQKGFNSYPTTNEKTGMEFDILIADKDEEYEFGEKENEIAIVVIDGVGEIFFDNVSTEDLYFCCIWIVVLQRLELRLKWSTISPLILILA